MSEDNADALFKTAMVIGGGILALGAIVVIGDIIAQGPPDSSVSSWDDYVDHQISNGLEV